MEAPHPDAGSYTQHPSISGITGYVVNVHDAINLDIDLCLSPSLVQRYRQVISHPYRYRDNGKAEQAGLAYRCRLRGIGSLADKREQQLWQAHLDIVRTIDRQGGWVICTVSDVDVYSRILLELFDPVTGHSINEGLLASYPTVFTKYEGRPKSRSCPGEAPPEHP